MTALTPTTPEPQVDGRDPGAVLAACVSSVLDLAATWTAWGGELHPVDDRVYTPHKAIRRVADHLIDHLAELHARAAGEATLPDTWHASYATTPADLAPFTSQDFDEARSRLTRLAQLWQLSLASLGDERLDARDGPAWSLRQVAFHVAGSTYYAEAVGRLPSTRGLPAVRPAVSGDG